MLRRERRKCRKSDGEGMMRGGHESAARDLVERVV